MATAKRSDNQITGNIGMYYVCYRLSELGMNVMPTARNAQGIDILGYTPDGERYFGIQVKTLSGKRDVPLGRNTPFLGDFWCIVVRAKTGAPNVYVMTAKEVKAAAYTEKDGSRWLERKVYEGAKFAENWARIVEGGLK